MGGNNEMGLGPKNALHPQKLNHGAGHEIALNREKGKLTLEFSFFTCGLGLLGPVRTFSSELGRLGQVLCLWVTNGPLALCQ